MISAGADTRQYGISGSRLKWRRAGRFGSCGSWRELGKGPLDSSLVGPCKTGLQGPNYSLRKSRLACQGDIDMQFIGHRGKLIFKLIEGQLFRDLNMDGHAVDGRAALR